MGLTLAIDTVEELGNFLTEWRLWTLYADSRIQNGTISP